MFVRVVGFECFVRFGRGDVCVVVCTVCLIEYSFGGLFAELFDCISVFLFASRFVCLFGCLFVCASVPSDFYGLIGLSLACLVCRSLWSVRCVLFSVGLFSVFS